jgi:hypothetical protein
MPWCASCEKNWTPTSLKTDGTCPTCGSAVEGPSGGEHNASDHPVHKTPWHFWVGVVAVVLYLGWRVIQGVLLLF